MPIANWREVLKRAFFFGLSKGGGWCLPFALVEPRSAPLGVANLNYF